jgi:hypothetical protein
MKPTITGVIIGRGRFQNTIKVLLIDENGHIETKELFSYYPDEISFHPEELVGLTEDEAYELRQKKDVAYLRS